MPLSCTSTCLVSWGSRPNAFNEAAARSMSAPERNLKQCVQPQEKAVCQLRLTGGPDAEKMNYAAFFVAEILPGSFRISIALLSCRSSSLLGCSFGVGCVS